MFYDSFLCEQQIDEIIPEEYEDWLHFCAGTYETSK